MTLTKTNPVMTLLAALSVLGAGALTYRLLAASPQEEAKKPAPNREAFTRLQLEMTQKELIQLQADLRKTKLELKFWTLREETIAKLPVPNSEIEAFCNQDPVVGKYLLKISDLRDQIAQAERVVKDPKDSPEIKNFLNEMAVNEKIIEGLRKMLQPHILAQLREKAMDQYRGKLIQLKEQIEFNEELEKTLKAEVERLSGLVADPKK
jgi:hypothetical protein